MAKTKKLKKAVNEFDAANYIIEVTTAGHPTLQEYTNEYIDMLGRYMEKVITFGKMCSSLNDSYDSKNIETLPATEILEDFNMMLEETVRLGEKTLNARKRFEQAVQERFGDEKR